MGHEIFGKRFVERNGYAWHGLARVRLDSDSDRTATHALEMADADFGVLTVPTSYVSPTTGETLPSGHVVIIRPAWKGEPEAVLGHATEEYTPLQNGEVCKFIDRLTGDWPVETLGSLRNGADLFLTLDAGTQEVGGDEIRQFFFVWNSHDGSNALKVRITPVRVVCANTCLTGDRYSTISADVRHTRRVLAEAEYAFELVAQMRRAQQASIANLDKLTKMHFSANQVTRAEQLSAVVESVYPMKEISSKLSFMEAANQGDFTDEQKIKLLKMQAAYQQERANTYDLRIALYDRHEAFNAERPAYANTGWSMYNAVTEVASWRSGGTDAQLAQSVLFGKRGQEMERAYATLTSLLPA